MDEILKGNYKVKKQIEKQDQDPASIESAFESSAFEKLGGSIAFVKKSSGFVWKGEKKDT